jgi:hypothetical protein
LPRGFKLTSDFLGMFSFRQVAVMPIMCLLVIGCTSYQYIPSHHYVHLHKSKGEVVASLNSFPLGLQGGYSISNHLFVFTTAYSKQRNKRTARGSGEENDGHHTYRGSSMEVNGGMGYYTRKGNTTFEIMAGGGVGEIRHTHAIEELGGYHFSVVANRSNIFLEPVIGFSINDYVEMGLFARLNSVKYSHIRAVISESSGHMTKQIIRLRKSLRLTCCTLSPDCSLLPDRLT